MIGLLAGACSHREPPPVVLAPPPAAAIEATPPPAPAVAPGLRLPAGVTPLAYELRLEVDPDREAFEGHVEIRTRLDAPTDAVWLHAVDLDISSAVYRDGASSGALTAVPASTEPMRGWQLERRAGPGEIVLAFDFTGHTPKDQEGLFRQRTGGHWYLYSQAEAIFARRILPCFDEPRFKVPWRVTLVVPHDLAAFGNAPIAKERVLADGRREVTFAEIGPLPTYLFAIAVGPFEIVDAGATGRGKLPVRVVTTAGHAAGAAVAAATTAKLVEALEAYFDQGLPWPKLDLVEVPRLFGAMEHVGLITFDSGALIGDDDDPAFVRRFVRVAGHELAHQWLGNSVTHAWWDDLWITEAFASWMADKLSDTLGGFDDGVLRTQLAREDGLAADAEPTARPLRLPITASEDIDAMFDAIRYEKGAAVLAMFEHYVGADRFRDAMRAYVREHARSVVTAADVVAAVSSAATPAVGQALASHLDRVGTPVVELSLRCGASPALIGHARAGVTIPVCARYPGPSGPARVCGLVGQAAELPLAACPAWVVGNDGGVGYYQVAWHDAALTPPVATASPGERLAIGDDLAGGVLRGDLSLASAVAAIRTFAATRDGYAQLAALAIARAIDPIVDDTARPRWVAWLAARFADRIAPVAVFAPRTPVERVIRDQLLELLPADRYDRTTQQRARTIVDRELRANGAPSGTLDLSIALTASRSGLASKVLAIITTARSDELRESLIEDLGRLGPDAAPRVVDTLLDARLAQKLTVPAVVSLLERPATRTATWHALRDRWPAIIAAVSAIDAHALVAGAASLCDATSRADLVAVVEPRIHDVFEGRHALDRALDAIDHCITRRRNAGDIPVALGR